MDGVIVDSEPLHYEVNKEIFEELNIEVSESEYNSYIGTSNIEMWTMIKKRHNLDQSPEKLAKLQQTRNYMHVKNGEVKEVSGVINLIKELNDSSLNLAIGSSSPKKLIEEVVDHLEIREYFDEIESGEDVENGKPDPDLFEKLAEKLNINNENILVIEDSHNGVKAAKNAGMKCIAYVNENSGDQDLSPADFLVDDFSLLSLEEINNM